MLREFDTSHLVYVKMFSRMLEELMACANAVFASRGQILVYSNVNAIPYSVIFKEGPEAVQSWVNIDAVRKTKAFKPINTPSKDISVYYFAGANHLSQTNLISKYHITEQPIRDFIIIRFFDKNRIFKHHHISAN